MRLAVLCAVAATAAGAFEADPCLQRAQSDPVLRATLDAAPWLAERRPVKDVRFSGLRNVDETALRDLLGSLPSDSLQLAAALSGTGLFARVVIEDGEVQLTEYDRVSDVVGAEPDVLDDLLVAPSQAEIDHSHLRGADCRQPLPPRDWLATWKAGRVHPGIVWRGIPAALLRAERELRLAGRPLATVDAEVSDGVLTVHASEGSLESVDVQGVNARLRDQVLAVLDLHPGDPLRTGDLRERVERVEERWPFLERGSTGPGRFRPTWTNVEVADDAEARGSSDWFELSGRRLVVHLHTRRADFAGDPIELLRHTPQTGFAPGLAGTQRIWDPADRVHLLLDGAIRINTRRPSREGGDPSFLGRIAAAERFDWLAGVRLRLPQAGIAEAGVQLHNLTDTADRWRIDRVDSYLGSALFNRPDSEYYRRSGFTALLTTHLARRATLGAEFRIDRYQALDPLRTVWTIWNSSEVPLAPAAVQAGSMTSVVLRAEWGSLPVPLHEVGGIWRPAELPLSGREDDEGLRAFTTLEIGSPALGGDKQFRFFKALGELRWATLLIERGPQMILRARAAGGHDLPLQKLEALGGWSALRGYAFKEFRGDGSMLGSFEVRRSIGQRAPGLGAFVDVGTVHASAGWGSPRAGAGALLVFDAHAQIAFAWRLDANTSAAPEVRLLLGWPLWDSFR